MPCFIGCFSLFFPRLAIVLVWMLGNGWLQAAYQGGAAIWGILGFIFMPLTVLAYAFAWHQGSGHLDPFGIVVIVIVALIDLGILGGHSSPRRVRRIYVERR